MTQNTNEPILLIDSNRGIYAWQEFTKNYARFIPREEREQILEAIDIVLSGPDNEYYWESVEEIEGLNIILNGHKYSVHQMDDIWAIPDGQLSTFFSEYIY